VDVLTRSSDCLELSQSPHPISTTGAVGVLEAPHLVAALEVSQDSQLMGAQGAFHRDNDASFDLLAVCGILVLYSAGGYPAERGACSRQR
jgi:hypothetical protein